MNPYPLPLLTESQALMAGYRALTTPYRLASTCAETREREHVWLCHAMADMRGCDAVIVEYKIGPEIWRHESELDTDPLTGTRYGRA